MTEQADPGLSSLFCLDDGAGEARPVLTVSLDDGEGRLGPVFTVSLDDGVGGPRPVLTVSLDDGVGGPRPVLTVLFRRWSRRTWAEVSQGATRCQGREATYPSVLSLVAPGQAGLRTHRGPLKPFLFLHRGTALHSWQPALGHGCSDRRWHQLKCGFSACPHFMYFQLLQNF